MRWFRRRGRVHEIAPDEIFLDSTNLPGHEASQFEGRMAALIPSRSFLAVGIAFAFVALVFAGRAFSLQIQNGDSYAEISRNNTLSRSILFATRGLILDRNGKQLAWNEAAQHASSSPETASSTPEVPYALRRYTESPGFSILLGFIQYPRADKRGAWWREEYSPVSGAELAFDEALAGENGSTMIEADARGDTQRENIVIPAQSGADLMLSVDEDLQTKLFELLFAHANRQGFKGGAGLIIDVRTGELIAITSFPEYDNNAFMAGDSDAVKYGSSDPRTPMLNRAVSGLYAPGSIVKPIFAAAALHEGIISPDKQILSTGALTLPNPYDPTRPSIFRDWTVHGLVDMRTAIAVSSDEYFYVIGGGYGSQQGLGIRKIDEYARIFGLGSTTGIVLRGEEEGLIPTPEWKEKVFEGDPWRIGNTYHTSIGQYGFQITPIQAVRYAAAIANGGKLLTPQLLASSTPVFTQIDIPDDQLQIVREGMRLAVTSNRSDATVKSLNISGIEIAGKTGTAQVGARNEYMNSWAIGFWPASDPHYAFAVVLERAPAGTLAGAAPGLRSFFDWLVAEHPEYLQ